MLKVVALSGIGTGGEIRVTQGIGRFWGLRRFLWPVGITKSDCPARNTGRTGSFERLDREIHDAVRRRAHMDNGLAYGENTL